MGYFKTSCSKIGRKMLKFTYFENGGYQYSKGSPGHTVGQFANIFIA